MKEIKHLFFTYRNGAVADTLRRYGYPHKTIFGLEIPRIAEIARGLTPSLSLARELWDDLEVRESRLLAAYLFPTDGVGADDALELACSVRTQEEADMLAFRLLKRLSFASDLLIRLREDPRGERAANALAAHLA